MEQEGASQENGVAATKRVDRVMEVRSKGRKDEARGSRPHKVRSVP